MLQTTLKLVIWESIDFEVNGFCEKSGKAIRIIELFKGRDYDRWSEMDGTIRTFREVQNVVSRGSEVDVSVMELRKIAVWYPGSVVKVLEIPYEYDDGYNLPHRPPRYDQPTPRPRRENATRERFNQPTDRSTEVGGGLLLVQPIEFEKPGGFDSDVDKVDPVRVDTFFKDALDGLGVHAPAVEEVAVVEPDIKTLIDSIGVGVNLDPKPTPPVAEESVDDVAVEAAGLEMVVVEQVDETLVNLAYPDEPTLYKSLVTEMTNPLIEPPAPVVVVALEPTKTLPMPLFPPLVHISHIAPALVAEKSIDDTGEIRRANALRAIGDEGAAQFAIIQAERAAATAAQESEAAAAEVVTVSE